MFSKRLINYMKYFTVFSHRYGATPYLFHDKNVKLSVDPKALLNMRRNYFMMLFWIIMTFGMLIRFHNQKDMDTFNSTLTYWLGLILLVGIYSIVCWFPHECCSMFNLIAYFYHVHFKETYMPNFNPEKNGLNRFLETFLFVFATLMSLLSISLGLLCLFDPGNGLFLGCFIPSEYFYFPLRIIFFLYHAHLFNVLVANMVFTIGLLFMYLYYLTTVLTRELRLGSSKYLTEDILRTPEQSEHLFLCYRSCQVLNANIMWLAGPFLVLNHGLLILVPTFVNVTVLRYWGELKHYMMAPLLIGSPLMVCGYSILIFMGRVLFVRGAKVLNSWTDQNWRSYEENKKVRRFKLSCRLVLLCHGTQFVVQKKTFFNYAKAITRGTLRGLLTTK